MGVPASSVNCFDGCGFLDFASLPAARTGAMRVPSPAAGMMTITFMAGSQYTSANAGVQMRGPLPSATNSSRPAVARFVIYDGPCLESATGAGTEAEDPDGTGTTAGVTGTADGV